MHSHIYAIHYFYYTRLPLDRSSSYICTFLFVFIPRLHLNSKLELEFPAFQALLRLNIKFHFYFVLFEVRMA